MIPRAAAKTLKRLARGFPVVALTGPRQSGKTTLAKAVFPGKPYVTLENPEEREFAVVDPRRFLERFPEGAIVDEVQRCPQLLSWLQERVDDRRVMGEFVITGSAQFDLISGVTQSLAGRVGRVELLPLSVGELATARRLPGDLGTALFKGGFPALYDRRLPPSDWFSNYVATYLERDVRQLINIRNLSQFQIFIKMCAARTGQLLNLASLATDCGISAVTARQWLSVLEASYIVTLLRPHHRNFGKRLVKTPKLYFLDCGMAAWLLGIRDARTLETHAARGALFETFVVADLIKQALNQGEQAGLSFWRDNTGNEIDLIIEGPGGLIPVEIKSGSTFASDWTAGISKWQALAGNDQGTGRIVYGGRECYERNGCQLLGWRHLERLKN